MKLYTYFRSSASYRVRIALALKGLAPDEAYVHLGPHRLEQDRPEFRAVNPQGFVPALVLDDGTVLTQSLAIIEYLDEVHPPPPLLPADPPARAKVRALAHSIACDIHPLNNSRVLRYLEAPLGHDKATIEIWYAHWIRAGFDAIETMIGEDGYCWGGRVSLADVCLVPQIANARRYHVDIAGYPNIGKVEQVCGALDAFRRAHPLAQPDAE